MDYIACQMPDYVCGCTWLLEAVGSLGILRPGLLL